MDSGIYIGNGTSYSPLCPVFSYNGGVFEMPVRVINEDRTEIAERLYPPRNNICMYGYNLCVDDYRGRNTDIRGNLYNGGNPLTARWSTTSTDRYMQGCDLVSVNNSYSRNKYFLPTRGSDNVNSIKQKYRGDMYSTYDPYLGVTTLTAPSFTGSSTVTYYQNSSSYPLYAYVFTKHVKITDLFISVKINSFDDDLYSMEVGFDSIYLPSTSDPSQCTFAYNSKYVGGIYLTHPDDLYPGDLQEYYKGFYTALLISKGRRVMAGGSDPNYVARMHDESGIGLALHSLGENEQLIVTPPTIIYRNDEYRPVGNITASINQFSMTFKPA